MIILFSISLGFFVYYGLDGWNENDYLEFYKEKNEKKNILDKFIYFLLD